MKDPYPQKPQDGELYPDGPWKGYLWNVGSKDPREFWLTLEFEKGKVYGCGKDHRGEFVLSGTFDYDERKVSFGLRYTTGRWRRCRLPFNGYGERNGIWGNWLSPSRREGKFRIWPRYVGSDYGNEPDVRVVRRMKV